MKEIKKVLLLALSLCSFAVTYAQDEIVIRGRVIDKRERVSVIGANVIEYDKENRVVNGAVCDVNGDFVLTVKDRTHTVKVLMIGYTTKTITPGSQSVLTIELEPKDIQVGEVVVTARKRDELSLTNIDERDIATASTKVDLADMRESGAISAADALQGRVAGLDIISASGDPGSGSQIVIRGLSSMGNNRPLVVIDGIPQYKLGKDFDLSSADQEDLSNELNIALQDIKSIEILKDAASTALYGSQGADGVLIIETFKGRLGKVQFDYTYKGSLNFQPPAIPMLNGDEYIMLQLEEWHNKSGIFEVPPEIAYDRDYAGFYNYSANTDWLDELTQVGRTHDHYFNITGGGERTRYFTSFNYIDETGTTISTGQKIFSTRVNLDYFLSKKTLFSVQFSYANNKVDGNYFVRDENWHEINVREMGYVKAPNMSIWEHDQFGNLTGEYFTPITSYQGKGDRYYNPVAFAKLGKNDQSKNNLQNNFTLTYTLTNWIKFRETLSFQFNGEKNPTYLPYNAVGVDWLNNMTNQAAESNSYGTSINTETQLSFDMPFADSSNHVLSGALSWITKRSSGEWMYLQTAKIPSVNIQDPSAGAVPSWLDNGSWEEAGVGGVVNLNYKYKDRYMLQGNLRMDAFSSFGAEHRWGMFKGLAAGWRFSQEPILRNINFLGESMLRASWGVSGRQPSDIYARFATYKPYDEYYLGYSGIYNNQIQLDYLQWESIEQTNIGIELNLFNDRVYIEGDMYRKVTKNILFKDYKIPGASGFDQLGYLNAGELENNGWELMLDYRLIRKKDLKVSLNFNTSNNVNSFRKFPDNFNREKSTSINNGEYPLRLEEGQPIGSFFGFRYQGVYSSNADAFARDANDELLLDYAGDPIPMSYGTYKFQGGDAKYEDINHDGRIDLNDVVYIGDSNPDFIGGFGASVKYKNLQVSCGFHYRLGFDIINKVALETQGMNNKNNQSKAVLSRWRVEGQTDEGLLPRAYMDHPANNLGSDRYVENGNYLRFLNLIIGYRFSDDFCRKLNMRTLGLTLSARKLFTLTQYTGQDPEIGQNASDPFWIGVDEANTPPPRVYTLSISVGF